MNIDKRLRDAAAATNTDLQHEPIPSPHRSTRPSGFASAVGIAALVVGIVATALLITGEETSTTTSLPSATPSVIPPPTSVTPSTLEPLPTTAPTDYVAPYYQSWSMEYPSTWYRADSRFFPSNGGESTSLATFEFKLETGAAYCSHVPPNAFTDLGPTDVLISIQLGGARGPARPPGGFTDESFPTDPLAWVAGECAALQLDLEAHVGSWTIDGHPVHLLVVFGDEVAEDRRAESWEIVSSLRTEPLTPHPDRGTCIATRPPTPGLSPPRPSWHEEPFDYRSVWYGTADLWTVLPVNGRYEERLSVWWSQNFTDAGIENFPDIDVTVRRVDRDAPPIVGDGGTNASTVEDGLFMIAYVLAQPARGCWSITGTYKGATLNYVVDVP